MITLVFSPKWFFGYDIIFEVLAVIVTLIIGIYSLKIYSFSKLRTYKYFGLSFLTFGASFLAKIAMNFALYNPIVVKETIQHAAFSHQILHKSNLILQAGYDIHRFLFLFALLGIYWIVSKSEDLEHRGLLTYFIFITALFSFSTYYIFHLTAAVFILYISKYFYEICFRKKKKTSLNAHFNFLAFALLFLSQVVFIFVFLNNAIYVIAEFVQLAGFIIFLINILSLVFNNGKKKNKN